MKTPNDSYAEKKMSKILAYSSLDYSDIDNFINVLSADKFFYKSDIDNFINIQTTDKFFK